MNASKITNAELEDATKSFVSIESAAKISRKHVRQKLEDIFQLDRGALYPRKDEINDIVQKILKNLLEKEFNKKHKKEKEKEEVEADADADAKKNDDANDTADEETKVKKRKLTALKEIHAIRKQQANMMTKNFFLENARTLNFELCENVQIDMKPRIFTTGSCGWHVTERSYIPVGNKDVLCHVCFNITIMNSKEWEL